MAPHRFHRKPNRQRSNTKTMNQMIVDIMELENDDFNKCNENPAAAPSTRSATAVTVMGDRNGNYRILDANTGHLLPSGQNTRAAREPSGRSHRPKGYDNRKKKDDHNVIERKRRNNINNLIKELRALLPQATVNETSKGSTLKATVDYMKELKRDRDRLKLFENAHKACDGTDQELLLRIQELENLVKAHAVSDRMNSPDQSQQQPINAITHDQEDVSMMETGAFSVEGQVKQELEQQYFSQTYLPFSYMNASEQDELSSVVLSEEELTNILNEMSPMDQMVSSMPDPLAAYFDMSLTEGNSMTITQLI